MDNSRGIERQAEGLAEEGEVADGLGDGVQGNPLGLEKHICAPFNLTIPTFDQVERTFSGLKETLLKLESQYSPGHLTEGIVFHHPDGRRAKIKRKDFDF